MVVKNSVPSAPAQAENGVVKALGGLINVSVTLTGITPLLQNAMSEECLLAIRNKEKPAKSAAKPSLREEADGKVHRLADGRAQVPPKALYACLVNAGAFIRLDGKRQISTDKKTILPGMLSLVDVHLPIFLPGTDAPATWEVDIQQGRNPNGGEAVCIVRPRFDEWELRCTIEVDQAQMPLLMAQDLISIAGRRIGLLDARPQRRGTFGRFSITSWMPERGVVVNQQGLGGVRSADVS